MSGCDRFEREGLLALEQNRPLPEHFLTCPECRKELESYQRLKQALGDPSFLKSPSPAEEGVSHQAPPGVQASLQPPAGWQERTWAAIERRQRRRSFTRRWIPAAAAIAAALLMLIVLPIQWGPAPVSFHQQIVADGSVRRGETARPGDSLILMVTTGGAAHAELRVYRDEAQLVLRCSSNPPCVRRGDRLEATLIMESLGRYQPLVLLSERLIPAPASGLDADAGVANAAGARVELGQAIQVR